ncbi:MAG: hypothetical protein VW520_08975, partial [Candidatus Puniceispirillum sp.]
STNSATWACYHRSQRWYHEGERIATNTALSNLFNGVTGHRGCRVTLPAWRADLSPEFRCHGIVKDPGLA